jgi:7-cyano-7-deazaguanine synthase
VKPLIPSSKTKALVILSGGQDSTTCLYWALQQFDQVHAVTYDYGQRHRIELDAAEKVASMAGLVEFEHVTVRVGPILAGASPLVSQNALEQYPDMYALPGGLEKTFVPGRNLLFLTLAANHAYARGIINLVTGVCQEDFGGYPDCRRVFIDAAEQAIRLGFGYDDNDQFSQMRIFTPLMDLTKAQSVRMAHELPGCWDALAHTHTAYDGKYPPTGNDHASLLRAKGFYEAGFPDPLVLRAVAEGLMPMPSTSNYDHRDGRV